MFSESILVVEPHPDDGLIGCLSILELEKVTSLFVTPELYSSRLIEGQKLCKYLSNNALFLGLKDKWISGNIAKVRSTVERVIKKMEISLVLIPDRNESHPDHKAVYRALHTLRGVNILGYSVWDTISSPDVVLITNKDKKLALFQQFYLSQVSDNDVLHLVKSKRDVEYFSIIGRKDGK